MNYSNCLALKKKEEVALELRRTIAAVCLENLRQKIEEEKDETIRQIISNLLDEIVKVQQTNTDLVLEQYLVDVLTQVDLVLDYKNSSNVSMDGTYDHAEALSRLGDNLVHASYSARHSVAESVKQVSYGVMLLSGALLLGSLVTLLIPAAVPVMFGILGAAVGLAVFSSALNLVGDVIKQSVPRETPLSSKVSLFRRQITKDYPSIEQKLNEKKREQDEWEKAETRAALMAAMH